MQFDGLSGIWNSFMVYAFGGDILLPMSVVSKFSTL